MPGWKPVPAIATLSVPPPATAPQGASDDTAGFVGIRIALPDSGTVRVCTALEIARLAAFVPDALGVIVTLTTVVAPAASVVTPGEPTVNSTAFAPEIA